MNRQTGMSPMGNLFDYLFGWRKFNTSPKDLVLEVGSGNHPLIRSDILCDKFLFSSYERFGHLPIVIDRPFIIADAMHLPFKAKSVDFIYCADLTEHLEQPHRFFDECVRVGYKGVIITQYPRRAHLRLGLSRRDV